MLKLSPEADVKNTPVEQSEVTTKSNPVEQQVTLTCPKHGDVTNSSILLTLKDQENLEPVEKVKQYVYCFYCLNELLLAFQREGALSSIEIKVKDVKKTDQKSEQLDDPVTAAVKKSLSEINK